MNRLNVDTADPAIKKFLRSLSVGAGGLEIELGGRIVCKIVPAGQLSDAEKNTRLADVRKLLGRSRKKAAAASSTMIDRDIRAALATVRGKQ